jgi:hypothetical protein
MTPDRDDPLLDAFLEELLGGQRPPNLSARILQAHAIRGSQPTETKAVAGGAAAATAAPPVQSSASPTVRVKTKRGKHQSSLTGMQWAAVSAIVMLVCGGLVGLLAYSLSMRQPDGLNPGPVADNQTTPSKTDVAENKDDWRPREIPREPIPHVAHVPAAAVDARIVSVIDNTMRLGWREAGVTASPPATEPDWCRRTHLALVGRIPTLDELDGFTDQAPPAKNDCEDLVDELLASDEFARNFTNFWTNVLIGRTGGLSEDSLVSRRGMQEYLFAALKENRPFDQVVGELISATGSNTPGAKDFNGATNFLLSGYDEQGALAADKTGRVFLGVQLSCAQCHDHPLNGDFCQEHFWGIASFYRQMGIERDGETTRLVNRDFAGDIGDLKEAGAIYRGPDGENIAAYPTFIDGTQLPRGGAIDEVDRRAELATMVTQSDRFSQAVVNRVWSHFMGRGFTNPIDDMGPHTAVSHPGLMDYLAQEFTASGYDMRRLVRWVVMCEAYGLSSDVYPENQGDDPMIAEKPAFSRYYTRAMEPEELYESLLVLAGRDVEQESYADHQEAQFAWLGQYAIDLDIDDGSELEIFETSYTQKLEMMNGDLIEEATDSTKDGVLGRVVRSNMSTAQKVDHLFLSALARRPTDAERSAIEKAIAAGDEAEALEDIWWALLNSTEFMMDR